MIDELLVYALSIYALFHVAGRSDLFAKPRRWAQRHLPGFLTYPLSCAFCFTIWAGVAITILMWMGTGYLMLLHTTLLAAPVINLIVDLMIKVLLKKVEPEVPPFISESRRGETLTSLTVSGGHGVTITSSSDGKISPSMASTSV